MWIPRASAQTVNITQVSGGGTTLYRNLTTDGSSDWRDWGTGTWSGSTLTGVKKSGGTALSVLTRSVEATIRSANDAQIATSWTGGDPTASATDNRGLYYLHYEDHAAGNYQFTVSEPNGTLYVYAAGYLANVILTVNQNAGPTETATFNWPNANTFGVIWKVDYSGGTLTVSVGFNGAQAQTYSNFGLKAAALENVPTVLIVTGLTGNNKVYDGTTAATASGTAALNGVELGDDVSLSGTPVFTFASMNVGMGIDITTTGYTLTGADAGKYTLTQPTLGANITALPVVLSGTRVFDETATADHTILSVANVVGMDEVTVASGSATLAGSGIGVQGITSMGSLPSAAWMPAITRSPAPADR